MALTLTNAEIIEASPFCEPDKLKGLLKPTFLKNFIDIFDDFLLGISI